MAISRCKVDKSSDPFAGTFLAKRLTDRQKRQLRLDHVNPEAANGGDYYLTPSPKSEHFGAGLNDIDPITASQPVGVTQPITSDEAKKYLETGNVPERLVHWELHPEGIERIPLPNVDLNKLHKAS